MTLSHSSVISVPQDGRHGESNPASSRSKFNPNAQRKIA